MKSKTDLFVTITCIIFLMANLAAIGPKGRSRAKEAACLSKLMKWGQIFQAYTADNNGYFHARDTNYPETFYQMWHRTYEPYYGDRLMLCCPAADNFRRNYDTFATWGGPGYDPGMFGTWDPEDYYGSYGFNRYVVNMLGFYESDPNFWRHIEVEGADNIPILLDCLYVTLSYNDDDEPPQYEVDTSAPGIGQACINRHDGGVNVCFMDFSARKVGLKELWTLKGNRLFDTCNDYTICGWGGDAEACADFWDDEAPWMSDFPEY